MTQSDLKRQKTWLPDVLFFVLAFLGFAILILLVNVLTNTWNGISGHALATILAGLMLFRYRWRYSTPGRIAVIIFSAVAGFSAIVYLYMLQSFALVSEWFSFEPLRGYELAIAFVTNALIFFATAWVRKRSATRQQPTP